jgi:hypothetical protein
MHHPLEYGKLQLSCEEAATYRAAAERLHETCEMALDLAQPISVEEWIVLEVAHAALAGELGLLDDPAASWRHTYLNLGHVWGPHQPAGALGHSSV